MHKQRVYSFSSFFMGLILILAAGIFIRGIKSESTIENRALTKFPSFSISSFIKTDYQSNLEQALSDQLVLGQTLKTTYNNIKKENLKIMVSSLKNMRTLPKQQNEMPNNTLTEIAITFPDLTPRGNSLLELDDSHHLVFPKYEAPNANAFFQTKANNINL